MNGPHDVGGMMGFGPVRPEKQEPVFHHEWEKRALGISLCAAWLGKWNIDESRHAYERIHPAEYLRASYYEIWIRGLDILLLQNGVLSEDDLFGEQTMSPPSSSAIVEDVLRRDDVYMMLASGPSEVPAVMPPIFAVGDTVITKNMNPTGHTRLPRYARDKIGTIEKVQGSYIFADDRASGRGLTPQWVYTVVFTAQEVWGGDADPSVTLSIDAFESYLLFASVSRPICGRSYQ